MMITMMMIIMIMMMSYDDYDGHNITDNKGYINNNIVTMTMIHINVQGNPTDSPPTPISYIVSPCPSSNLSFSLRSKRSNCSSFGLIRAT